MTTIRFNADLSDNDRRTALYRGELFAHTATPITLAFIEFAQQMIRDAFPGLDPETAQYQMPVEEFARRLGALKPAFIHHPDSKRHLQAIVESLGCDPNETYFEVPKMRSSTSDGYLTAGIAYAWHPHRDTWYSAPQCQINWWLPIFELVPGNAMAFHPRYWTTPVKNSSSGYNYYEWNVRHRGSHITQFINEDPRPLPRAIEPIEIEPLVEVHCPPGGLIMFSGAQLHSSMPNRSGRTRFSIDFRTVHRGDLARRVGAKNIDSASTGTVLREFVRTADLKPLPDEIVALYEDGTESHGAAIYQPT